MKTGRLLKLPRPGADLHVYLYQDGPAVKAAIYAPFGAAQGNEPLHTVTGQFERAVEDEVRAWVDAHFPKLPAR